MAGPHRPFRAERYDLPSPHEGWHLSAVAEDEAPLLAARYAAMAPWTAYRLQVPRLARSLWPGAEGGVALALRSPDGRASGVAVVRDPWLAGPYMQFLAVHAEAQGRGLGTAILGWMEREARRAGARNLWICTSDFNVGAQRLYQRLGFEQVVVLDGLLVEGIGEMLMRKRLA